MTEASRSGAAGRLARAVATAACLGVACGGGARPAAPAVNAEPCWQDVFDRPPELLLVLRPKALRDDKVYGPLLRRALELARQQSPAVASTHALDAVEDADEVIIGAQPDSDTGELVFVLRGVRADIDPAHLVDAQGRRLWAPGPAGQVLELERNADSLDPDEGAADRDASLFELPGRTWLIATGRGRLRARAVFARPLRRSWFTAEPDVLATARVEGRSLLARSRALQPSGGLAAIGRRLQAVTFALPAGALADVRVTLWYPDEATAAQAELETHQVIEALGRSTGPSAIPDGPVGTAVVTWLASAQVSRQASAEGAAVGVVLTVPLPSSILERLSRLSAPVRTHEGAH